ncbi:PHP domain-containing protein [Nocardia farcinica]|uniref:DNA polymerase/3'-5' exonuclease PolX n=2 Tax=Nocardia farcinica TaxID=37329 RepID=A0A0H5P9C8_NOCFR|nr:PHP domain-containing protein [Nocardia farcinica]AXK88394.1 PHP domain-containing protein [Nocardia farcinica]MBA4857821.1 PHP domain-containing protein [Nocardia farcinica]MBC9815302.1 PHP domain-containing protein [Nocardia farcinica]MBF6071464.1 PHP domain-containing protein [Nocardia farcinica]MBF6230237.1 PHP domain-containing protein [Nocardia farcinica]
MAAPGTAADPARAPGPVEALREIGFWLERARAETHRVKAYRRAAEVVAGLTEPEVAAHAAAHSWQELPGIGPKTAAVIAQACAGEVPAYLAELRRAAAPIGAPGKPLRQLLRGDLHTHSNWSDGGSPIEEMMRVAAALGHEYCALTDHSPRLTVANGLSADRLRRQLDVVAELNERLAPFRILTGIEVDILDDGTLDQRADLLAELDVVVASVHSHLRAESEVMTKRMVYAVANPHVDVLGHCTGRLVTGGRGTRPESTFDAEMVFEACRQYGTAVEINSRPERLDPPSRLLTLAVEMGCLFAIDTDAHAPGQLDWLGYGCERAVANGVAPERVINTWPVADLLTWTRSHS